MFGEWNGIPACLVISDECLSGTGFGQWLKDLVSYKIADMNIGESRETRNFLILTGLSGSGMSSATNAFEDLGYFCVDNLPIALLPTFVRLLIPDDEEIVAIEKAALVIDIREGEFLQNFSNELEVLGESKTIPHIVFFEASDEILQQRFSETRRPHPADRGNGLLDAIRAERQAMTGVRARADQIIDTSSHTVHTLRRSLIEIFGGSDEGVPIQIRLVSFGHKHGVPTGLDLLFDVRHLPNPYFDRKLRHLTGQESQVIEFLESHDEVNETIDRFTDLLLYLLPLYQREGKSYLTIGVGCTGGKHRSVMSSEKIWSNLKEKGYGVTIAHRDIEK